MFARHLCLCALFVVMVAALTACGGDPPSGQTAPSWQNYPHLFTTATNRRWLVVMCKLADDPDEPSGMMDLARKLFGPAGVGFGNLADYYSDISYGAVSLAGTKVMGWYTAPYTRADVKGGKLDGNRAEMVRQCAESVPSSDVYFPDFYGIVVATNFDASYGACYDGQRDMSIHGQTYPLACVILNLNVPHPFGDLSGSAHEVGHGLGLHHAFDDGGFYDPKHYCSSNAALGEYCDHWDVLGDGKFTFTRPPFNQAGPGLVAPQLLRLGWIPSTRIFTYHLGDPNVTVRLKALSHPEGFFGEYLTAEIVINSNYVYTVEYRQKDGWDAAIADDTVLIHEYDPNAGLHDDSIPYSWLQVNSPTLRGGEQLTGSSWISPQGGASVRVDSIDPSSGTATVEIGSPGTFVPTPIIGSSAPIVQIQAPADNAHVTAGVPFQLVAKATTFDGHPLPSPAVVWKAEPTMLGTGAILITSLATPGVYTISVTGTDNGQSARDSHTLYVDPPAPPPPTPTAQILSPTNGQTYRISQGGSVPLALSSTASAGVTQYAWSDSLHLFTDSKPNDTVTIQQNRVGCANGVPDTINLAVTDSHGQTGHATPVTITFYPQCIA
jgi:M6 family metalloprotease-like protein